MYLFLLALRTQSIAVDDNKPYAFPSMKEIADLSLPNGSLASISIPSSVLEEKARGKVHEGTKCYCNEMYSHDITQYHRENVSVSG